MSGVTFDDLVAVATLGVSRKGFAAADLDGPAAGYVGVLDTRDPAAALLDAAALLTVAARAGVQLQRDTAPRAAVAVTANGERELSARGSQVLARIGMDRLLGPVAHRTGLLGDLLTAMREAGFVLPAPLLPNALDIALRAPELKPTVASVLGTRGRWLAAHRADWQKVADAVAPTVGVSEADGSAGDETGGDEPEMWRVGTLAQRRDYLIELRDRDPRAGRELLAAGWSRESKEERAGLLAALDRGLSADDEDFLENALGDRAGEVREVARRLLARLPGSAFSRRAADRATAVLRLEGDGPDARLIAHLPDEVDKAAVRDGIDPRSPAGGVDAVAWRLLQVIAGAPLAGWTSRLRMTPAQLVALPVEGAPAIYLRAGKPQPVSRFRPIPS